MMLVQHKEACAHEILYTTLHAVNACRHAFIHLSFNCVDDSDRWTSMDVGYHASCGLLISKGHAASGRLGSKYNVAHVI
jgi:hypothetical protein